MSTNYFTAKKLTRKHKLQKANKEINYPLSRQLFLRANLLNFVVYKVFSSIVFFSDFFSTFLYTLTIILFIFSRYTNLMKSLVCTVLQSFFKKCSSLKTTPIYECPFIFAQRYLIGSKILYFYTNISFKIPNMSVKCSRSLFLFYQARYIRKTDFFQCSCYNVL